MEKIDKNVYDFIENLGEVFSSNEISIIKESYDKIKVLVGESLYADVASTCVTSILLRKKLGKEISYQGILEDFDQLLVYDPNEVMFLRDVKGEDAVYNYNDNAFGEIIDKLKCSKDLANAVFLDILNGEDVKMVAMKYKLTREQVDKIYAERLSVVESILVVDHDIVIKDVESRPHTSNVKIITDSNK